MCSVDMSSLTNLHLLLLSCFNQIDCLCTELKDSSEKRSDVEAKVVHCMLACHLSCIKIVFLSNLSSSLLNMRSLLVQLFNMNSLVKCVTSSLLFTLDYYMCTNMPLVLRLLIYKRNYSYKRVSC